ncbi:hypothetical protein QTO34_001648 [Cnephaeus nilssonii]|uniref:Ubiquitin-like domain-containing protein n=1 Tax=Cnephaeus nilssonii TaxID=3371016 RepID=A0AA40HW32_CNENI|nr:hypothetical protein QTO34_001648 [Eptesicus nilssonii]
MESPAPTPRSRSRNADRSSMFRFFRSLVGSKGGPKSSGGTLLGGQECPSQEQRAGSVMMHRQGIRVHFAQALEVEQRATGPLEVSPEALAMEEQRLLDGELRRPSLKVGATPWNHILALYKQFQKLAMAKVCGAKLGQRGGGLGGWGPGCEARAGQWEQSSLHLRELRGCFLLYVEVGLQAGPAHLLSDRAHPQLPLEEESEEEEMEEEDSSFKLCVPVTFQSPLHKTFRPIDTVGFVESELKKLLVAQQESRRRKTGSHEGWEPLVPPEITLEGIMGDQGLLLEEMDDLGNWPPSE